MLELDGLAAVGDRGGDGAPRTSPSTVRAGEILGIAGVAGNGQRELAEAIDRHATARRRHRSRGGHRLRRATRASAIAAGIAHVPEDRLHTGVAPSLQYRRRTSR